MIGKALALCLLLIGIVVVLQRDLLKKHLRAVLLVRDRPRAADPGRVGLSRLTVPGGPDLGSFTVDLRYPVEATGKDHRAEAFRHWAADPTHAFATRGGEPAETGRPLPLILYFPSWFAKRDESSFTLTRLASQGFIVAALDDIVSLPFRAGADAEAQHSELDFSSDQALHRSRALAARRAVMEAEVGSRVIDTLDAAAQWKDIVDTRHVGVLGFSFGGAAAVTLSRRDRRVCVVVNLDGSLYGESARLGVEVPYLVLFSDTPFHSVEDFTRADPVLRLQALMDQEEIDRQRRDAGRADHQTFVVAGLRHEDFSDRLIIPAWKDRRSLTGRERARRWSAVAASLTSFFSRHLGPQEASPREEPAHFEGFRTLAQAEALANARSPTR